MKRKTKSNKPKQDLRQDIRALFRNFRNKKFNHKEVAARVGVSDPRGREIVLQLLNEYTRDGFLKSETIGSFQLNQQEVLVEGFLDITSKGFGYVRSEETDGDIFIPENQLGTAFHGDKVKVSLVVSRGSRRLEGKITEVVERAKQDFVGIAHRISGKWWFRSDDPSLPPNVEVLNPEFPGLTHGQKVIIRLSDWNDERIQPEGHITEVLGLPGDHDTEMWAILAEFGFPLKFPDDVIKEAEALDGRIRKEDVADRRDMRDVLTFTIDPVDAKDFDDAISFRDLGQGEYEIGIHIADVSHFLKEGSALDREAARRATSVYLIDRVLPMLPENLSNLLCSLRPKEDKFTFSTVVVMDDTGNIRDQWFGRTLIHSDRRFSYEEAQEILEGKADPIYEKPLHTLNKLAEIMREARFNQGAIKFESRELKFTLDEQRRPIAAIAKERKAAHMLIEDFMLLANKLVTIFVAEKQEGKYARSFVYRIHDAPDPEKLRQLADFVALFGYDINTRSRMGLAASMNKLVEEVQGKDEQEVIESMAIRTMAKAVYSTENIGHYGLAFPFYTHFTSPIRRYPDVMVHRILQEVLKDQKPRDSGALTLECRRSSEREKAAAMAERASVKYKQIEMLLQNPPETVYQGIITDFRETGMYIEIAYNYAEGFVRYSDMKDDQYSFEKRDYEVVGKRWGTIYRLGQHVQVLIKKGDLRTRQIDWMLINHEDQEKNPSRPVWKADRRKRR